MKRRNEVSYQKKISRIVFFARRGDFRISKMVALSLWVSVAVKFLCKYDKVDDARFVSQIHVPVFSLSILLTTKISKMRVSGHFLLIFAIRCNFCSILSILPLATNHLNSKTVFYISAESSKNAERITVKLTMTNLQLYEFLRAIWIFRNCSAAFKDCKSHFDKIWFILKYVCKICNMYNLQN